ncbi:hypothetical protein FDN13_03095 [Caloramator sp. E03]|uniref:YmaF family protein n=1 Tax=Caloramator sp. E03 TaxID=2576307 RepID=UPI0011104BAE|nr:YmaF family protein [Caloramator sp. E03]QCX32775.1 hypothetical protein FDN13_03095 [Caloramator sp. E03]
MYHKHQFSGTSSYCEDHEHSYCSESTIGLNKTPHSHYLKGVTSFSNGHCHTFCITSEKDIQIPGGWHVHLYHGITDPFEGHTHNITGYTFSE